MVSNSEADFNSHGNGGPAWLGSALIALAGACILIGGQTEQRLTALICFASASALCAAALATSCLRLYQSIKDRQKIQNITQLLRHDIVAAIVTDGAGHVVWRNDAARDLLELVGGDAMEVFRLHDAPSLRRIRAELRQRLQLIEMLETEEGAYRINALRVGEEKFLWRIEPVSRVSEETLDAPTLTVGRNDAVLAANESARKYFGKRPKHLSEIMASTSATSDGVQSIKSAYGIEDIRVVERILEGGRRQLKFSPHSQKADPAGFIMRDVPVPMIRLAPSGSVLEYNTAAEKLLCLIDEGPLHIDDLFEGLGHSITDWVNDIACGRNVATSDFVRLRQEDCETFLQITLQKTNSNGEDIVAVLNDATELKTLEAQFVQSQKMQAIGQLAGGVAHDFNNLLTAISGHCDLMLLRHDAGDMDYADLVQIHQNANRAAALVGQLLAFSRKQTLQPETLDIRDALSDLTHLLNRLVGEKVTLSLSHDPVLRSVRADKRQLEQVIMNLVVNARDAMPDGGNVVIETEGVSLKTPLKRDRALVPSGEYVGIRVHDQGTGIPSDKIGKIFEPFFTTKRTGEGTGLGLSMAYGIVKQTGGYIFADSQVGNGTCFTILLPAEMETHLKASVIEPEPENDAVESGEGVVLLVEDEAPVRAFASRALAMRGFEVLQASCAEEALKLLEDRTLQVDIFVTDVVMPGMDGPTWVKAALNDRPDVKVVFVSGYAEKSFKDGIPNIPNSVFLPKPFSLTDLTATVQRHLN